LSHADFRNKIIKVGKNYKTILSGSCFITLFEATPFAPVSMLARMRAGALALTVKRADRRAEGAGDRPKNLINIRVGFSLKVWYDVRRAVTAGMFYNVMPAHFHADMTPFHICGGPSWRANA
jgi:hypothetical protein